MRYAPALSSEARGCPLLEIADLPGAEDWSVMQSFHFDDGLDQDDDGLATRAVARAFDD